MNRCLWIGIWFFYTSIIDLQNKPSKYAIIAQHGPTQMTIVLATLSTPDLLKDV